MKVNKALELKNKGNNYFKSGDYENALQCYGKALEIDPKYRDAWNNIYITLLKLERTDDAKKCKEILDKLTFEPDGALGKDIQPAQSSLGRKIFIGAIIIMLLISITVSALAILGWISSPGMVTGSPEHILSGFISGISAIVPQQVKNPSADTGITYSPKNIGVTAGRFGNGIVIRNYGGPDSGMVTDFTVRVDGEIPADRLGTTVGSSISINQNSATKSHVVVTAKFSDGSEQVVLDTTV